jgi:cyclopropane-fatty-acyl-phospholipid synthase
MKKKQELLIDFIKQFDEHPFAIEMDGEKHLIGEGDPTFVVKVNKPIDIKELVKSTSIALGEAYMKGDIEVEGDLYTALNNFLGQLGKFSKDIKALKKLMLTSKGKKNQKKRSSLAL